MEEIDYRRKYKYNSVEELAQRNILNGYIELKGLSLTQEEFDDLEKLIINDRFYKMMKTKLCIDGFFISENKSNFLKNDA